MPAEALTAIYYKPYFSNGTPARVNRKTGAVCITDKFLSYPPNVRKFILLHEAGHVTQQTTDEIEADNFAFNEYAKTGGSITDSIKALTNVLNTNSTQSQARINEQLERAIKYDYSVNKNQKLKPLAMKLMTKNPVFAKLDREINDYEENENFEDFDEENENFEDFDAVEYADFCADNNLSPFSDMSRKEFRAAKQQAKIDKKNAKNKNIEARAEVKNARADAKRTKAEAKKSLADQGIDSSAGKGIGDALGGIVGGIFGKKKSADDTAADTGAAANTGTPAPDNKKTFMIIGAVVVVIIIVVVIVVMKKKKK